MSTSERSIADLTPEQLAKLQEKLRQLRGSAPAKAAAGAIPRRGDHGPAPLSFAQQRLWFLDQLEPGSPAYNIPFSVRMRGPLDVAVLARTLREVVRRHETLRTTFPVVDGEPVQRVSATVRLEFPLVDLSRLDAAGREAEAARLAREEALRGFDLARGPLLRGVLLRLEADDHVALFTLHHVISDGWSARVMVGEFSAIYAAFSRGMPSPLPDLPVQYADFAAWQRAWLAGGEMEAQLAWWRGELAGMPPLLELP
ncbi:MAG: non-ribosomal peptide synthetase, partial [Gemmatimonadetes bacterium]|nr:non-ribosomal peptide synthetase [Gemmatimonadota bacterium]